MGIKSSLLANTEKKATQAVNQASYLVDLARLAEISASPGHEKIKARAIRSCAESVLLKTLKTKKAAQNAVVKNSITSHK